MILIAKEKWAKVKANGFVRYVIIEGIFKMGGMYALLIFLYDNIAAFAFGSAWARRLVESETYFESKIFDGVLFGLLMGLFIWVFNEGASKTHANKPKD